MKGVLLTLLSESTKPISPTTVVTTFQTLSFSECVEDGNKWILPLVVKVVVDLKVLDNLTSINIEAPGTVDGAFSREHDLEKAELIIDTNVLLSSMMSEARANGRCSLHVACRIPGGTWYELSRSDPLSSHVSQ